MTGPFDRGGFHATQESIRQDALKGALQDSSYLVTPKARLRLLKVLNGEDTPEANAARLILKDGGLQQGTHTNPGSTLADWADAVDILSAYLGEPEPGL